MSKKPAATGKTGHTWEFASRFRRHAFGWKSQPAIARVKEAVAEIKHIARLDPTLAADGAVLFLERVSPAIEHVDGSSGAMGTAVRHAVADLVTIIINARADTAIRNAWLERIWQAHQDDGMPYIEQVGELWGDLCGSGEVASAWADRLLGITRMALSPDDGLRGYYRGTTGCLSALYAAKRYTDILELLDNSTFWPHKRWAVKALGAMDRRTEAIELAESLRGPWTNDADVDELCEAMLLSCGLVEQAYRRYGLRAARAGTYVATVRAVAKNYPHMSPRQILADLVKTTPGDEGKWFAAAKTLGFYGTAIELARASPCDPRTLARAARDHAATQPEFAIEAAVAALEWLVAGYGYEITSADVWMAYQAAMQAAEQLDCSGATKDRILQVATKKYGFVEQVLGRELGLGR